MVTVDRIAQKAANKVAQQIPIPWRSHASGAAFDSGSQVLTVKMVDAPDFTVDMSGAGPPSAGGGVNPGTQYYTSYYATTTNAVSALSYLQTDASNNIILSGASNIAKTAADFQSSLGVATTFLTSGAATFKSTIDAQGNVGVSGNLSTSGNLILDNNTSSYKVTLDTANGMSGDYTLTLPTTDGDSGQYMVSNGSGVLSWTTPTDANYYTSTGTVGTNSILTGTIAGGGSNWTASLAVLYGLTNSGSLYVKTGSRNQMHMDPTLEAAKLVIRDEGGTNDISEFMYYPRISIEQDGTDPTTPAANAGYPSLYFLKYGPSGVSSPVGGDPVGWRQVASGAAGASTAPQYMVWEYSTDMDGANFAEKLKLKDDSTLTATTFAGALLGTINTATTATTQSSSDNSTKVATTAYADAAAGGAGTIGGSITDNQVAFGASSANSIEGSSTFIFDGSLGVGTASPANRIEAYGTGHEKVIATSTGDTHAVGFQAEQDADGTSQKWQMQTEAGGTGFQIRDATDGRVDMHFDGTGEVGIGTTAPTRTLDVRGRSFVSGATDVVPFEVFAYGAGTSALHITSGSDIGIGTATPLAKVHINAGAYQQVFQRDTHHHTIVKGNSDDRLIFATGAPGSHTTRFSILSTGVDVVNALTVTGTATLGGIAMGGNTVDDILLAADSVSTADDELVSAGYINARYAPVAITGTIGGSIATDQIAFGASANTIEGTGDLTWTHDTGILALNSRMKIVSAGALGVSAYFQPLQDDKNIEFREYGGTTVLAIDNSNQRVGIGTVAPAAKLEVLSTTEQLRLAYDGSNESKFTVDSTGSVTWASDSTHFYKPGDGLNYFNGGSGENRVYVFNNSNSAYATYSATYLELRDGSANIDVRLNAEGSSYFAHRVAFGTTTPLADIGITVHSGISLKEQGGATADTAAYGQFWVKSDTPNKPYFTDDAGTDFDLTATGTAATPGGSDTQIQFNNAGAFGGVSGFTTTDDGSDVTLTSATASKPVFNINNTNDDASAGELQFYKSSDSVAVNDNIGKLSFYFDNNHATPQKTLGAKIYSTVQSGSDGAEGGYLYFSTMKAGTEVVTMTLKSGNVGFGPNSPGYHYMFSKHASADTSILIQGNNNDWLLQNKNADGSLFWKQNTDAVSAMTLTSGGNLGIGTTVPSYPLHVVQASGDTYGMYLFNSASRGLYFGDTDNAGTGYGKIGGVGGSLFLGSTQIYTSFIPVSDSSVNLGSSGRRWSYFFARYGQFGYSSGVDENSGSGGYVLGVSGNADRHPFMVKAYGETTPNFIVASGGNVGIGTTSPSTLLEVQGGLTTEGAVMTLSTKEPTVVANDVLGRINFQAPLDTGLDSDLVGASIAAVAQATFSDTVNSTALYFQTGDSETATTKMMINEDGQVGIGTLAPDAEAGLEVFDKDINIGKTTSTDKFGYMFRGRSDTGFYETDNDLHIATPNSIYMMMDSNNNNTDEEFSIWRNATLTGSATELFTVRESGNVGIGTGSPSAPLHVRGSNVIFDMGSEAAVDLDMGGSTAGTRWRLSPGTDFRIYDNWDYTNQRFTIKRTTGYVGIGTTAPAQLLDVSGSQKLYGSFNLANGAITSNPGTNHLWASGATLFWGTSQIGTTTPGAGAIEGTATAGEVAYGDGSNSITSSSNFLFDGTNLKLIDSKKLILGTGDDFQIYHNGSNSYLENNTGDLSIINAANDADIKFKIKDNTVETEVIRIVGATSRVGIGTTSPNCVFHVNGDMRIEESHKFYFSGDGNAGTATFIRGTSSDLELHSGDDLYFNAADDIRIASDQVTFADDGGNVHLTIIETGTNGAVLESPSSMYLISNDNLHLQADDAIQFLPDEADQTGGPVQVFNYRGGTEYVRFDGANQRVGIGTTSPSRKLDVNAGSATALLVSGTGGGTYGVARIVDNADSVPLELVGQRADGEGPVMRLKHESASPGGGDYVGTVAFTGYTSTNALGNYAAIRGRTIDVTNGSTDGALLFQNFIDNSRVTGMVLSGSKLGVGPSGLNGFAPSEYLEVKSSEDDDPAIKLYNARSPAASGALITQHRGSSINIISTGSAVAPFRWTVQSTEMMRLDDTGLGIGTTAPASKLDVVGSITAGANSYTTISNNEYDVSSGDLLLDVAGDITLDAGGSDIKLSKAGGNKASFYLTTSDVYFGTKASDGDFYITGSDGGSAITALHFDMSEAGNATFNNNVTVGGVLTATAKSFNIPHPLYKDKRLVHGSLEGPEHGLYIRGTIEAFKGCLIELPEYWSAMCEDYTVQLTPHGAYTVFIKEKQMDKIMVGCSEENYKFDYYIVGARTDETLEVVQDG